MTLHFTSTSASWMNLAEVFFSIITRQEIRRGSSKRPRPHRCHQLLHRRLEHRLQPFIWTNTADEKITNKPANEGVM